VRAQVERGEFVDDVPERSSPADRSRDNRPDERRHRCIATIRRNSAGKRADPRYADRTVRAPRGTTLACRSWLTEAAYRMIQNNLDPEVAEDPRSLVVYGGIGRAAATGRRSTRSSRR
jgi:hypothetical protein